MRKEIKALKAPYRPARRRSGAGPSAGPSPAAGVLDLFHDDMAAQLDRYVSAHREQIVGAVENWWDKYKVTLQDIEGERDGAAKRLKKYLDELGHRQQVPSPTGRGLG